MQPRRLLASFTARAHCWLMVYLFPRTPRSVSGDLLPSLYWCVGLFLPRRRMWHPLLGCMRFLLAHFPSLSRSLWLAAWPFGVLQYQSLGYSTNIWASASFHVADHNSLGLAVHSVFSSPCCPLIYLSALHKFFCEDVTGDWSKDKQHSHHFPLIHCLSLAAISLQEESYQVGQAWFSHDKSMVPAPSHHLNTSGDVFQDYLLHQPSHKSRWCWLVCSFPDPPSWREMTLGFLSVLGDLPWLPWPCQNFQRWRIALQLHQTFPSVLSD